MIQQNKDMIILIWFVKTFFNVCLAWFGLMAVFQGIDQDLFLKLVETMPSRVAFWLGLFYLIFIVLKKASEAFTKWSDAWAKHQINKLKVKKKQKELNDKK